MNKAVNIRATGKRPDDTPKDSDKPKNQLEKTQRFNMKKLIFAIAVLAFSLPAFATPIDSTSLDSLKSISKIVHETRIALRQHRNQLAPV
jgi:hypothetical protein